VSDLTAFNAIPAAELQARLTACLDVPRWVDTVVAGRPYADLDALLAVAGAAAELDDDELAAALARHPRIGERAGAGHDAALSAREQSGVDRSDAGVVERLAAGNRAYEQRFDRVFLIRAAGRDASGILAELERRLGNDDDTERAETIDQLRQIALLRLQQVVS
jgi:2-oxo-4-hydroxy-4-carboxy-5-ureidoimidazoline decarboxylase